MHTGSGVVDFGGFFFGRGGEGNEGGVFLNYQLNMPSLSIYIYVCVCVCCGMRGTCLWQL